MQDLLTIYTFALSGHSHRVELLANLANLNYETINVNLAKGEHKTDAFLAINPFGQLPAITIKSTDNDRNITLSDSNAILWYLASQYAPQYLPTDPLQQAKVQQFLTLASGELIFGPAAARLKNVFNAPINEQYSHSVAVKCFTKLELSLENKSFLLGETITIADIAMYTYAAHAPEGSIDLTPYPNVCRFLKNIENLPGFKPMQQTNVGLYA